MWLFIIISSLRISNTNQGLMAFRDWLWEQTKMMKWMEEISFWNPMCFFVKGFK